MPERIKRVFCILGRKSQLHGRVARRGETERFLDSYEILNTQDSSGRMNRVTSEAYRGIDEVITEE